MSGFHDQPVWHPGMSPFGTVPVCWGGSSGCGPGGNMCTDCMPWWAERVKQTPNAHRDCDDPHAHGEHMWSSHRYDGSWQWCEGHDHCPVPAGVDQWIRDYAYAPDDFVLGGEGLSTAALAELHELLDLVRPGWRALFEECGHCGRPDADTCGCCPICGQTAEEIGLTSHYCCPVCKKECGAFGHPRCQGAPDGTV